MPTSGTLWLRLPTLAGRCALLVAYSPANEKNLTPQPDLISIPSRHYSPSLTQFVIGEHLCACASLASELFMCGTRPFNRS
jgi:hypothetical protein